MIAPRGLARVSQNVFLTNRKLQLVANLSSPHSKPGVRSLWLYIQTSVGFRFVVVGGNLEHPEAWQTFNNTDISGGYEFAGEWSYK
jgi:hypothetical protein